MLSQSWSVNISSRGNRKCNVDSYVQEVEHIKKYWMAGEMDQMGIKNYVII